MKNNIKILLAAMALFLMSCEPIYIGGNIYKLFCLLNRLLPKRLVNWIVGKLYC